MTQQSRRADPQTGGNNAARTSPLQATIVTPEQALSIKPFGLDVKVLLTTEAPHHRGHRRRCLGPHGVDQTR